MKKVVLIVAAFVLFDFALVAVLLSLAWHPVAHLTSRVLVSTGERLHARHEYAAAIARYDQALTFDPKNADAYAARAYAHTYLGQFDAALADGEQAVATDDHGGAAYGARGWAREWKGDWKGAQADYDQAIRYQSNVAASYAHRGWARFQQKENEGAMKDYDEALKLSPHLAFAYEDRAWLKFREDDLPGALEDENAAIEFSPGRAECYLRRSDFRLRSDDAEGALADARAALDLEPRSPGALFREGVALRREGNSRDSIDVFGQVLQINAHYGGALFERAMSKYAAGDVASAAEDLQANRVNGEERPRTELWLWIATSEQGLRTQADRELSDYLTDERNVKDGTWPEKLGDMMLGRIAPEALAASLEIGKNDREHREQLCELWFFAGKIALLHGDKARARADFRKALDSHAPDIVEFSEARRELGGM